MIQKIFNWTLVAIWMSVIFYFSNRPSITTSKIDTLDFLLKKTAHLTEYTILFILLCRAFRQNSANRSLLAATAFAFSDEMHQLFTPGRGASLRDVLIDITAITFVYIITKYKTSWKYFR